MEQSAYSDVTDTDYEEIQNIISNIVKDTDIDIMENPHLKVKLDTFIQSISKEVGVLLKRHHNAQYVKNLEVESLRETMLSQKHQIVKMNLRVNQVSNACKAFYSIK